MAAREHSRKEELKAELAAARASLQVPDTGDIAQRGKSLLSLAGRLPANVPQVNTRTLVITASLSCLLVLLIKPRRKRGRKSQPPTPTGKKSTFSGKLMGWVIAAAQPLIRSYLKKQARSWLTKNAAKRMLSLAPTTKRRPLRPISREPIPYPPASAEPVTKH
ncbi:MAG: hypothetical protein Q7Q71_07735 [Verrucomicrobiota bacterium JB023]|nr:hypothetical protein [Verrucomicrobiota bacterium JB023]